MLKGNSFDARAAFNLGVLEGEFRAKRAEDPRAKLGHLEKAREYYQLFAEKWEGGKRHIKQARERADAAADAVEGIKNSSD